MILLSYAFTLRAQEKIPPANGKPVPAPVVEPLTVVSQGRDFRVVEWLTRETTDTGEELVSTNSYTEIATGLHYPGPKGEWLETVAEFVPVAGGYLAARGPHQVALSTDLSTPGAVTVVTPDGQTLRSTPTLLAYVDRISGKSMRLANLKPSKGELTAPNMVLYTDAFDTLAADVRATYTAGAFESDVILRKQLPAPDAFGFDPGDDRHRRLHRMVRHQAHRRTAFRADRFRRHEVHRCATGFWWHVDGPGQGLRPRPGSRCEAGVPRRGAGPQVV